MILFVHEIIQYLHESGIAFNVKGNKDVCVDNYSSLNSLKDKKVTWVKQWSEENIDRINSFHSIVVIGKQEGAELFGNDNCLIMCDNPKMVFFELLNRFYSKEEERVISSTAIVETDKLGQDCAIGHYSVIGKDVVMGEHVTIGNHVTLQGRVVIGDYVTIHSGCVIGKSGYGYYKTVDGHMKKVPHLGRVRIESFVEIGANTCIDCGTMDETVIEKHVKIDNLCHIAHNVHLSEDVCVVAGSIVCGSVQVGERGYIAPGAVIKNQVSLGKDSFVGIQSVALKDLEDGTSIFGVPGRVFKREYEV